MARKGSSALGGIIRQQRELAALPMRQLAIMVGISNPYLSQIERGLRTPSEEVLQAIASSLQVSADVLRAQTGARASVQPSARSDVLDALACDTSIDDDQRAALRVLYRASVKANSKMGST